MILPKKAHFIHRTPTHKDEGLNGIEIFMIQSFYMTMYVKKRGKKAGGEYQTYSNLNHGW